MIWAINLLLVVLCSYLALCLAMYWIPLLALKNLSSQPPLNDPKRPLPFFFIVAPCHNSAEIVPGLIECLRQQKYEPGSYKILILADNCEDNTISTADSLGVEVYVRNDLIKTGKGYALNEFLEKRLKHESFDALILVDIDARVKPDFLLKVAAHVQGGSQAIQGATESKNAEESNLTKVGDLIQSLLRSYQQGRAVLKLDPIMIGSHGIALTRESLAKLNWFLATDLAGDDFELGIRCFLNDIPVTYAADVIVTNDLPVRARDIRKQRRRWISSTLRIIPKYVGPLLRKGFQGRWKSFDVLFNIVLNLSFSHLFFSLTLAVAVLGLLAIFKIVSIYFALFTLALWILDVQYFTSALSIENRFLRFADVPRMILYLGVRAIALLEGFVFLRSSNWWPTYHGEHHLTENSGKDVQNKL